LTSTDAISIRYGFSGFDFPFFFLLVPLLIYVFSSSISNSLQTMQNIVRRGKA
jgi:hypothetical protein